MRGGHSANGSHLSRVYVCWPAWVEGDIDGCSGRLYNLTSAIASVHNLVPDLNLVQYTHRRAIIVLSTMCYIIRGRALGEFQLTYHYTGAYSVHIAGHLLCNK